MELLPTISTLFIIISAIFVAIGWRLVIKKKYKAHKKAMLAAAFSALAFFLSFMYHVRYF